MKTPEFEREREIEALKAEIDFYKDMTTKVFTVDLVTVVGTVTTIKASGVTFWSVLGIFVSYGLSLILGILISVYKQKVNQLRRL
jgi:hypothetical protein